MRVAADGNSSPAAGTAKGMQTPGKASTWKVCTCIVIQVVHVLSSTFCQAHAFAPSHHHYLVRDGSCAYAQELQKCNVVCTHDRTHALSCCDWVNREFAHTNMCGPMRFDLHGSHSPLCRAGYFSFLEDSRSSSFSNGHKQCGC